MKMNLSRDEYKQIAHLAQCASESLTKKDAQPYLTKLNFIYQSGGYGGSAKNIIGEVYSYASSSAGRVADKAHWQSCLQSSLYKLESLMVEKCEEETTDEQ
ncbi:MAG: hypothetical protein RR423_01840 [Hydrogenoanaerobacterium sp.]